MSDCLFCQIIKDTIPAKKLYEDDEILAFYDVSPQAPTHFLVIPKEHISTLNDTQNKELIGKLSIVASKIATNLGFAKKGFRVVMNCNEDGGQTVYHIHLHCLAGRQLTWPPG
ncbi:Bis(5'-nucleosyl)-tetraphosphatase (asymmetrical) [hydrothermal vent metagenome]|uniref:Bis(5'-nucleosyl)-tetraphosphatase (Asymmetrical) n=1 Tax=hydrothermal vent metagenome TaxID=652676 RepID=A0A1W1CTR3_9ZZZZ